MNRLPSLLAVVLSFATACGVRDQGWEARSIGERFVAAFGSGDQRAMQSLVAPDVQWNLEGIRGREGRGAEDLLATLSRFRSTYPDAHIEELELLADGARVMVCGRLRGTNDPASEVLPRDRQIEGRAHVELHTRDGQIESLRWCCGSLHWEELPLEEALFTPDWCLAALDLAGPTRALTLDPDSDTEDARQPDRDPATGARRAFGGYVITGAASVEDLELRRRLSGLLYQGLYLGYVSANCFQPRHALEVEWNGEKLWIVICFECMGGYVEREDGSSLGFSISSRPEPAFSEIYRSLGLRIAPSIEDLRRGGAR